MEKIILFDTTLRDGEQASGNTLLDWEKVEIAEALAESGVDVIEAGFPSSSDADFNSVKKISEKLIEKHGKDMPVIAALAMAKENSIERAADALKEAIKMGKGRIHVFIASSEIHADRKLKRTQSEILDIAVKSIKKAKIYTNDIEFSPEDASRTGIEFLLEISREAVRAGATTVNIPDTVGYAVPDEFGEMINKIVNEIKIINPLCIISAHCHNDLGMAVQNSLAAIINGARQVEVAINGIGERAGNASLEQIAANLIIRKDYFEKIGVSTSFNLNMVGKLSRLVAEATGNYPSSNTPIIGANAFSHQAGVHQDGVAKHENTYEIMSPEEVGWIGEKYHIGKHSGKSGIREVLKELGYSENEFESSLENIREKMKELSNNKKSILDEDLRKILLSFGLKPNKEIIELDINNISYNKKNNSQVFIPITIGHRKEIIEGKSSNPLDAALLAIKNRIKSPFNIENIRVSSTGRGKDTLSLARVIIKTDKFYIGRAAHEDSITSIISAFINALNRSNLVF